MSKTAINARIDTELANHLKQQAAAQKTTVTKILEDLLISKQNKTGPAAENARLKAIIAEQDRIIRKHTGRGTPEKRRVTITLPIDEIASIDKRARQAGMTRGEFLRGTLTESTPRRILQARKTPALPV